MASTGNAADFGDMAEKNNYGAGFSSNVRGVCSGGNEAPAGTDRMQYVTIASAGDTSDFGNLTQGRDRHLASSNSIRGVSAGGFHGDPGSMVDTIDYVTIATTGDAADFGDLSASKIFWGSGSMSDSHGGLQG